MAISVTQEHQALLEAQVTRPITLVRANFGLSSIDSLEARDHFSSGSEFFFNNDFYEGNFCRISNIVMNVSAQITIGDGGLSETGLNIAESVASGAWRNQWATVYSLIVPLDATTADLEDSRTVLHGQITLARYANGRADFTVTNKRTSAKLTPRNIANEIARDLPAAGSILSWNEENIPLKVPRT